MNSREWRDYFRQNRQDQIPVGWDEPVDVAAGARPALTRSLARFQLGESSEGRWLRRRVRQTGDAEYAEAIALFIGEEQKHAQLLARALERLGAARLRRHWSDSLFRLCRHLPGFYGEISVLLMAEIVSLKYYSAVWNGTADAALRRVCEQILHDEKFHVRFHCEYLHRRWGRRRFIAPVLTAMFARASAFVAWDHREALWVLGSSPEDFLEDSWANFAAARHAIVTGEPFVWSRTAQRVESPAVPPVRPRPSWAEAVAVVRRVMRLTRRALATTLKTS